MYIEEMGEKYDYIVFMHEYIQVANFILFSNNYKT